MCVSDDVSSAMQSVAELAAEPLPPRSAVDNDSEASRHIVDHFNGHRILKRLICNDVDRLKHSPETGKSLTSLSFLFYSACPIGSAAVSCLLFILKNDFVRPIIAKPTRPIVQQVCCCGPDS